MNTIKRILVPTDFSEVSTSAYTHAQELARKYEARVDLIHVVPLLKYFSESISKLGVPINMGEDLYPHVKDGAEHRLRRLLNDYFREKNQGKPLVLIHRNPPKAIVEFAEAHDYDLIIMAARGDHHTELLRGGVAEKVIRLSEVPVFTVNNRFKMGGLRRILVPTDTSTESFSCFPLALELAELYERQITLLHVPELYGTLADRKSYHPGIPTEESIYRKILENLYEYLVQEELSGHISINRSEENYTDQIVASRNGANIIIPLKIVFEKKVFRTLRHRKIRP